MHLSVHYYEIVKPLYTKEPWLLTAIACLILACKFTERDDNVPLITDLIKFSARKLALVATFTYEQVTKHEMEIMRRLDWDLFRATVLSFVDNYTTQGLVLQNDQIQVAPLPEIRVLR